MINGIVKWFNDGKGYGFVVFYDSAVGKEREAFIHYTQICGEGFKSLAEGEAVSFEAQHTPKGVVALNVKRAAALLA